MCVFVCIYICIHICVCVYIYIYIYTHTNIHTFSEALYHICDMAIKSEKEKKIAIKGLHIEDISYLSGLIKEIHFLSLML